MAEVPLKWFNLVLAFLCPGFLTIWGLSVLSETLQRWLGAAATQQTSVGGFLFATIAALGVGALLSGARWLIFDDRLLKSTKVKKFFDLREAR